MKSALIYMYRGVFAPLIAAAFVATAAMAEEIGDAEQGEKVFRKCASCHQLGQGAEHRVGPHLNGIFGRKAGTAEGYTRYSPGLLRAGEDGLIWSLDNLSAYLENPKSLVSGTRMNFRGLKDADERANVLAYMRQFSDNPANIPEAQPTALPHEITLPPEILAIVGDPEYGEYLASECQTCHRSDGSDQGIPSITGWPTEDFVLAMHAYKQKLRTNPVMQNYAGRLTDEEIAALAAYFAGL
jgi:cytochrome c